MTSTLSTPSDKLQEELTQKMMGIFDMVVSGRSKFYAQNPGAIPNVQSVSSIISSSATKNMAISGGASLIPGPWGMIAVVPEIALVIKNQVEMIYDIGVAYGKQQYLTKELLASVFAYALGTSGMGLLVMQGSKVLIRRSSLRVFQRLVSMLAGKVTQRLLKSMISKWVPVVGAAAMATWSNFSTREVGKKAVEIFSKDLELSTDVIGEEESLSEAPNTDSQSEGLQPQTSFDVAAIQELENDAVRNLDSVKIQALMNLMKVDNQIQDEEQGFIQQILEGANVSAQDKIFLASHLNNDKKFDVNYQLLANSPDDAISLMLDMVALAHRDGALHVSEKLYIRQVGKVLGLSEDDVRELLEA